jgi:hypothetical protein
MVDDRGVASNGVGSAPSWMPPLAPEAVYAILRQAESLPLRLVLRALDTFVKGLEVSIATAQHPGEVLGGFNSQLAPLPRATARLRELRRQRGWQHMGPRLRGRPNRSQGPRPRERRTARRVAVATTARRPRAGASRDGPSGSNDDPPPERDLDRLRGFRAASSRMFAHVGCRLAAGAGA